MLCVYYSLISTDLNRMTDSERDQIDQDAQTFMRTCSDAIKQLRSEGVCSFKSCRNYVAQRCVYLILYVVSFVLNILMNKLCFYCLPVEKQATPAQVKEHRGAVLDIIELYLTGNFLKLVNI